MIGFLWTWPWKKKVPHSKSRNHIWRSDLSFMGMTCCYSLNSYTICVAWVFYISLFCLINTIIAWLGNIIPISQEDAENWNKLSKVTQLVNQVKSPREHNSPSCMLTVSLGRQDAFKGKEKVEVFSPPRWDLTPPGLKFSKGNGASLRKLLNSSSLNSSWTFLGTRQQAPTTQRQVQAKGLGPMTPDLWDDTFQQLPGWSLQTMIRAPTQLHQKFLSLLLPPQWDHWRKSP